MLSLERNTVNQLNPKPWLTSNKFFSLFNTWAKMIKLEHTLFSLPFVLISATMSLKYMQNSSENFSFNWIVFLWIILCLFGARSAGMTLNRIIDASIDKLNPRTANREIPAGKISKQESWYFSLAGILVLIFSAFQLPKICQILLPIPIIWVWAYPYLKRFTWFCHFFLGTTLGGATLGAWIAVSGAFNHIAPFYLFFAISFWVGAFDIIYAIGDLDFDREKNLNSIPAKFGKENSLRIVKFLHFLTVLLLYLFGESLSLGLFYKIGLIVFLAGLVYEQKLAAKDKLEAAFFTVNSWLGIILLLFLILDLVVQF
ncbi:MAG: putative 4-hydroxybenzoate polyprenyltransferase [Candidatus Caenarcaniphilales bacterium]|nr:putative 4-hydroxybenzoate polyprenyltransferase [Candidatus Caenarcaniphilales bacterium]